MREGHECGARAARPRLLPIISIVAQGKTPWLQGNKEAKGEFSEREVAVFEVHWVLSPEARKLRLRRLVPSLESAARRFPLPAGESRPPSGAFEGKFRVSRFSQRLFALGNALSVGTGGRALFTPPTSRFPKRVSVTEVEATF